MKIHRIFDYDITGIIKMILKRWIQQHQGRSPIMTGVSHLQWVDHLSLDEECSTCWVWPSQVIIGDLPW